MISGCAPGAILVCDGFPRRLMNCAIPLSRGCASGAILVCDDRYLIVALPFDYKVSAVADIEHLGFIEDGLLVEALYVSTDLIKVLNDFFRAVHNNCHAVFKKSFCLFRRICYALREKLKLTFEEAVNYFVVI